MNKLVSCIMLLSLARPLNVASLSTSSASKLFAARGSAVWSGSCALFSTSSKTEVTKLPEFASKEDYITFIESQAALPQGFSIGTAKGTFVPVEAPMLGNLPIKATVVKFDEPTESWAACFTKNKVCKMSSNDFVLSFMFFILFLCLPLLVSRCSYQSRSQTFGVRWTSTSSRNQ